MASLLKNGDWILVYQQKKSEAFAELIHAQITAIVVIFIGAMLIVIMNISIVSKSDQDDRQKPIGKKKL